MAEYPSEHERALKRYVSTFRCQVCRCNYEGDQARVAARHDQLWVVSVRCRRCRNQQLFYFAPREDDPETGMRDVNDEEEARFAAMDAVTSDEVLDMYEFLREFNGDFKTLFSG
jgi:hypothetical protein